MNDLLQVLNFNGFKINLIYLLGTIFMVIYLSLIIIYNTIEESKNLFNYIKNNVKWKKNRI